MSPASTLEFRVSTTRHLQLILGALLVAAGSVLGVADTAEGVTIKILNSANYVNGFTVPAGEIWRFDPNADVTITSGGNVIVLGTLEMKPANGNIDHVLRFTGISESGFVGGGMDPVAADVGLWVRGAGQLDLKGEAKTAWSYQYQSSWAGDEVRAAPNTPNNYSSFPLVTRTPSKNALGYSTELLNLTRNVRIEGTQSGYTHVNIRSSKPQAIRYVALRYVGPNPGAFSGTDSTGRYGLHFHHNGNDSRGSLVDGVVVRDASNHAFVPHASHGITFRNTIAYNVKSEAYWWDDPPDNGSSVNDTHDVVFDRAVAARVTGTPGGNTHRLAAFYLGRGVNPTVVNSVAVGMQQDGGANRSGFLWPEDAEGTWNFRNNRAHNNEAHGIHVWQNNELPHVIDGFIAYYNDQAGVSHGAYTNSYVYKNLVLLGNGEAIHSNALGEPGDDSFTDTQIWANIKTNGGTLLIDEHGRPAERPVRFVDCDLGRVVVRDDGGPEPSAYDFIRCGLEPSDFDLSGSHSDAVFRVQRSNGTAFRLLGNGSVTSISPFYNGSVPGTGFFDTKGHTFAAAIDWLAAQGITKGCNPPANDRFCPNDPVTRGEMAVFLVRAVGYSDNGGGDLFIDDDGLFYENSADRLFTAKVTVGCNPPTNNRYCGERNVSRGQMAAFLARAFQLPAYNGPDRFVDDDGDIFENAIEKLAQAGITVGCNPPTNDRYCPNDVVTRGQMAAFLKRALQG